MLLKNDRSTNELPPLHDPFNNFNLAYDATQKSNVLNKYFCSITKLNDDDAVLPDFHDRCEHILSQVIVTEQEVIDMLCTLNANKAVGKDLSPFLNKGITWAIFQSDGNTFSRKDLLNKLHNGFDISSFTDTNILLLIISGPTALLALRVHNISITSCSVTITWDIIFSHLS
jgi:hypothetical protein